ncbi:hypothetical protein BT96DRAFT_985767 [Gymnopus androsaceus JB14]|uniref:HMG box domain-containing protein n=1 Tax=Gymnopus androsaceus JB14 TaxID=1447944 RepID=A0A6A4ICU8_9AGAR|nr:hypothetical protein BT96DRAFT_985767 [Gymnopus androsaceus JB14]
MPALRTRDTQSRRLEVTTETPTLAMIAPTPYRFTFPISHNLSSDSPYSTPSNSPFKLNLNSLAVSPPPTSSSNNFHLRSEVERRPKKGDENYIKRPENAFILFRRKCCEKRQAAEEESSINGLTKKRRQADLSKTISQQWKSLTPQERKYWDELAKEKKKEHEKMYPGYVYRPSQRVRDKDGKTRNCKRSELETKMMSEIGTPMDPESVLFVISPSRRHCRSASAPTPPPISYQSNQIPNLRTSFAFAPPYQHGCSTSAPPPPILYQSISDIEDEAGFLESEPCSQPSLPTASALAPPYQSIPDIEDGTGFLCPQPSLPTASALTPPYQSIPDIEDGTGFFESEPCPQPSLLTSNELGSGAFFSGSQNFTINGGEYHAVNGGMHTIINVYNIYTS